MKLVIVALLNLQRTLSAERSRAPIVVRALCLKVQTQARRYAHHVEGFIVSVACAGEHLKNPVFAGHHIVPNVLPKPGHVLRVKRQ